MKGEVWKGTLFSCDPNQAYPGHLLLQLHFPRKESQILKLRDLEGLPSHYQQLILLVLNEQIKHSQPVQISWELNPQNNVIHISDVKIISIKSFDKALTFFSVQEFSEGGPSTIFCSPLTFSFHAISIQEAFQSFFQRNLLKGSSEIEESVIYLKGKMYFNHHQFESHKIKKTWWRKKLSLSHLVELISKVFFYLGEASPDLTSENLNLYITKVFLPILSLYYEFNLACSWFFFLHPEKLKLNSFSRKNTLASRLSEMKSTEDMAQIIKEWWYWSENPFELSALRWNQQLERGLLEISNLNQSIDQFSKKISQKESIDIFSLREKLREKVIFHSAILGGYLRGHTLKGKVFNLSVDAFLNWENMNDFEKKISEALGECHLKGFERFPLPDFLEPKTIIKNGEDCFSGVACYQGIIQGEVQVITNRNEMINFTPGKILILRYLDPLYYPLLRSSLALVTEVGGVLSHGGILAREARIPTVLGVKMITKKLKSGDKIEVNGDTGKIQILSIK